MLTREEQERLRKGAKQSIAYAVAYFRALGMGKLDDARTDRLAN
jgi:hypothetical protein